MKLGEFKTIWTGSGKRDHSIANLVQTLSENILFFVFQESFPLSLKNKNLTSN